MPTPPANPIHTMSPRVRSLLSFLRNWALPISMAMGVLLYFLYAAIPALDGTRPFVGRLVEVLQPALLFVLLFLSFCRIKPSDLCLRPWYLWVALIQVVTFVGLSLVLVFRPDVSTNARILWESALLCAICPTATAAPVITLRLGGNIPEVVTYTILINLVVAVLFPLMTPLVDSTTGLTFVPAFLALLRKLFPLLVGPLALAWFIRYTCPRLRDLLADTGNAAFYVWTVSLCLAIAVSTRSIVHSHAPFAVLAGMALIALVSCLFHFIVGRWLGGRGGESETVTAGQTYMQKNTALLIWMGLMFLTPVTGVTGGFYSIWQNLINSWQLQRRRKRQASAPGNGTQRQ